MDRAPTGTTLDQRRREGDRGQARSL